MKLNDSRMESTDRDGINREANQELKPEGKDMPMWSRVWMLGKCPTKRRILLLVM